MSAYLDFRAVPPPALRNSAAWLRRLFHDNQGTVRDRVDRVDRDQQFLYTDTPPEHADAGPGAYAVLGGGRVYTADAEEPPFLLLTAAQTARVAAYLAATDFDTLWRPARAELLPRHGGPTQEPHTRAAFAAAHRELTAFYTATALHHDAVVKWPVP
ncbi:DUF1877 family protein [Streptomyces sp. NPDC096132]|uniref:DUF1877 family protein n=1 Tax=Streptomyces sp. NPDC096132 TaxID=3366075 RepID=UPI0037F4C192